jgi:hypothetical protein
MATAKIRKVATTNPRKMFNVFAKINLDVYLEIDADSLEDALTRARDLTVNDFVSFTSEHSDSDVSIEGIHSAL